MTGIVASLLLFAQLLILFADTLYRQRLGVFSFFDVPFPRSVMYVHLPKPNGSVLFSITREVRFPHTIANVPPGWCSSEKLSSVLDIMLLVCCQVFLRIPLNLVSVVHKDQFTLVSARHKAPAPIAWAIENLNCVPMGSVVSFNPLGFWKMTQKVVSASICSGWCPHVVSLGCWLSSLVVVVGKVSCVYFFFGTCFTCVVIFFWRLS